MLPAECASTSTSAAAAAALATAQIMKRATAPRRRAPKRPAAMAKLPSLAQLRAMEGCTQEPVQLDCLAEHVPAAFSAAVVTLKGAAKRGKPPRQMLADLKWEGSAEGAAQARAALGPHAPAGASQQLVGPFYAAEPVPARQRQLLLSLCAEPGSVLLNAEFMAQEVVPRLRRTHPITLRLLQWMLAEHSRDAPVHYVVTVGGVPVVVNMHQQFSELRARWRRRWFDTVRRRHRVLFDHAGRVMVTTVAQLHFFVLAERYGFLAYAAAHGAQLKAAMQLALDRRGHRGAATTAPAATKAGKPPAERCIIIAEVHHERCFAFGCPGDRAEDDAAEELQLSDMEDGE